MAQFDFNPNDLHRLNRLVFMTGAALEETAGGHRTRRSGEGTDFLDYRPYAPGDDFRNVDWSLYGRLRQLIVRLREAPRQLSVTLLIDVSRSVSFGQPITKLHQAQRIACALGFIGLRNGDRVFATSFADTIGAAIGPLTGARSLPVLVKFLSRCEPGGNSNLRVALNALRARRRAKGLIVILSDFLNVSHCEEAISSVLAGGAHVLCVQVLDRLDRGVGLTGNLRLRDSESGRQVDVNVDDRVRETYQAAFEERCQQFEQFCTRRRVHYLRADTSDNYLELVCDVLRSKALVR